MFLPQPDHCSIQNVQYGTSDFLDEKNVHLMGQCCSVCPLNITVAAVGTKAKCKVLFWPLLLRVYARALSPIKICDLSFNLNYAPCQ